MKLLKVSIDIFTKTGNLSIFRMLVKKLYRAFMIALLVSSVSKDFAEVFQLHISGWYSRSQVEQGGGRQIDRRREVLANRF